MHNFLATEAKLLQKSANTLWKEVHRHLHSVESIPKEPAEPLHGVEDSSTNACTIQAVENNWMNHWSGGSVVDEIRASGCAGCPGGCFYNNSSQTVVVS